MAEDKNKDFTEKVKKVVDGAPLSETKIKNKAGRKPLSKNLKKNKPVMANFTDEEYEALKNLSEKLDRTVSSIVRMAALDMIKNY